MNLSTIILSGALILASNSAVAKIIVFKTDNDNLETRACVVAAKEGVKAAKQMVEATNTSFRQLTSGLSCNGLSLSRFAKKYSQEENDSNKQIISLKLVVDNAKPSSKVCLDALLIGEQKARIKNSLPNEEIYCNDQKISSFVSKFSNKKSELAASAE